MRDFTFYHANIQHPSSTSIIHNPPSPPPLSPGHKKKSLLTKLNSKNSKPKNLRRSRALRKLDPEHQSLVIEIVARGVGVIVGAEIEMA